MSCNCCWSSSGAERWASSAIRRIQCRGATTGWFSSGRHEGPWLVAVAVRRRWQCALDGVPRSGKIRRARNDSSGHSRRRQRICRRNLFCAHRQRPAPEGCDTCTTFSRDLTSTAHRVGLPTCTTASHSMRSRARSRPRKSKPQTYAMRMPRMRRSTSKACQEPRNIRQ